MSKFCNRLGGILAVVALLALLFFVSWYLGKFLTNEEKIVENSDQGGKGMTANILQTEFEFVFNHWKKDYPKRAKQIIGTAATQYSFIVLYRLE